MFQELVLSLTDSSRPTFLFGCTPPREGTTEEKARETAQKFLARSAVLATDGYIVYDIQDEKGRTTLERPFPFRKTLDPSWYASLFHELSAKSCVVYKSVVEGSLEGIDEWMNEAILNNKHTAFNLVGAPSSSVKYKGPTISQAMQHVAKRTDCSFGCVAIPERHTTKGNEHMNMLTKTENGAKWFITQGIFDVQAVIKLLHDYGDACRQNGVVPRKILLTFAPCGRPKTMTFIKWLGMNVPEGVHDRIMTAEKPVEESILVANELLNTILEQTHGCGVPIGMNVESLSIFKDEIEGAHTMFRTLQATLLNSRGSPWAIRWYCVPSIINAQGLIEDISPPSKGRPRASSGDWRDLYVPKKDFDEVLLAAKGWFGENRIETFLLCSIGVIVGIVVGRASSTR